MRRVAAAIEMARPVIFMASDLASYMTGRSIIVDGGWTNSTAKKSSDSANARRSPNASKRCTWMHWPSTRMTPEKWTKMGL